VEETTPEEVFTGARDAGVIELSPTADKTLLQPLAVGSCFFKAAACETRARSAGLMAGSVPVREEQAVHGGELRQKSTEAILHRELDDLELFAVEKLRLIDED